MAQRILFCDIDGTLVHYVDEASVSAEPDEQGLHSFSSQVRTDDAAQLPVFGSRIGRNSVDQRQHQTAVLSKCIDLIMGTEGVACICVPQCHLV
jgi:sugar lactone lactonase YvrE